jgi:hypothetical protein
MCSGRDSSFCSTYGIRLIYLTTNPVISHEWEKNQIVIARILIRMSEISGFDFHSYYLITSPNNKNIDNKVSVTYLFVWRVNN